MGKKKHSLGGWLIAIVLLFVGLAHTALFVLVVIGIITYWVIKKFVSSSSQEEPRTTVTFSGGTAPSISRDVVPSRLGRSRVADDLWIPPGQPVTIGKFIVPDGMIYVGRGLPSITEYRGTEPALIDPSLKIASKNPDHKGSNISYWPSYSEIPPTSRLAYLEWLALGRNNPEIDVGYVFLFFYGLERRLLFEAQSSASAQSDASAIISEVRRLLSNYGHNNSFRGYASSLIGVAQILFGGNRAYEYEPTYETRGGEFPHDVRLALSQLVADGKPIPGEWALAWYLGSPETRLRTPASRCANEFRQLFQIRYEKAYGAGLVLKPNKTRLKLDYQPASASFGGSFSIPVSDLPDVTRLKRPLNQLTAIAEECCSALDSYSRWFAKNSENPRALAGIALLPGELLSEQPSEEMTSMFERLNNRLDGHSYSILEGSEIVAHWPSAKPDRMTKKETTGFLQFLEKGGFGIEPDVRFGGKSLSDSIKVVLFRLPEEYPTTPSSEYKAAVVLLRLAVAVAAADGSVDESEENHLQNHLEASLKLSHGERTRLTALWRWLVDSKTGLAGLKKRLELLDADSKQVLANFAVGVAGADGIIDPEEVKTVRSIYKLLGMDPEKVYGDIHAMTAEAPPPATEPVTVRPAKKGPAGFAVPPPQKTIDVQEAGFQLDKDKIAAKMAETAAVSSLLSEIFVEEESSVSEDIAQQASPETSSSSTETSTSIDNLDNAHSALLSTLFERSSWTRSEFEQLAANQGLLPDGAIDTINEAAFDICDEPVLEGDDPVEVNQELMEDMSI